MNKEQIITSFGIILEMLHDRGETVDITSKEYVKEMLINDNMKTLVEVVMNKTKVIYYTPPKFKWADVQKAFADTYDLYILVLHDSITSTSIAKYMNNVSQLNIEIHYINRLQFNITKHVLVPKHEVIRDKNEIESIVTLYKLKNKYQLPLILKSDPIARYYAMKNGDLVKITRPSETAGEYIVYRCCL